MDKTPTPVRAAEPTVQKPAPKVVPTRPLAAGQVVAIAAGRVWLGSVPGTVDREPSREADQIAIELPAFTIDRLPFPNDPAQPPLTNVTRDEAAQKCSEVGKRLCSEQEWERACEGDDDRAFPMGASWNTALCGPDRIGCDSALGVSELGLHVREWTASVADSGIGVSTRTAVTRGHTFDAAPSEHRCSARNAATPDSRSDGIGFRCCQGEAASTPYPIEANRPALQALELDVDSLRAKLKSVPELAAYADTFTPIGRADVSRALARGDRSESNITLWTLTPAVFAWAPMPGEEIVVVSGHVGDAVLLAALYPHEGRWLHGVSTLLLDKDSSIAIGFRSDEPTSLIWTSCWGCYGEGGRLSIGADRRVGLQFH
jgi:hypothetical protein